MQELAFDQLDCNENLLLNCSLEQIEGMLESCDPSKRVMLQNSILKRRYSPKEEGDETCQLEKLEYKATSRIPKFEEYWIERPGTDGDELVYLVAYNSEPITCYEIGEDG